MDEAERRTEAVRRRLAGESPEVIAADLGRTTRWVRKWTARFDQDSAHEREWAQGRSRAPLNSPRRTDAQIRQLVLEIRGRLVENPQAQYGALAIGWELAKLGVDPVPHAWTINRIIAQAGLARPRRRPGGYTSKNVPYPRAPAGLNELHQADMVGPRHLDGAVPFHALNLVDLGSHAAGSEILPLPRPTLIAAGLLRIWDRTGLPETLQLDNHVVFRGAIPPQAHMFGPVVATCLDLQVTPRFIPLREPWRNGVVEHFNDVWDKAFFRTDRFPDLHVLAAKNAAFEAFHNSQHRYSAHHGASPEELRRDLDVLVPVAGYRPPAQLPRRGRIEVVRFVRSNLRVDLFGRHLTLPADHAYSYVTAVIKVRGQRVTIVTTNGEVIREAPFPISTELR